MANLRANKITSTEVFETTGSVQFDGSGDYLSLGGQSDFAFGTGDFTIEGWIYFNAGSIGNLIIFYDSRPELIQGTYLMLQKNASDQFVLYVDSAIRIISQSTVVSSTWYHITVSRSNNNTKLFVNGIQEGLTYIDSTVYLNSTNRPVIGVDGYNLGNRPLNGFISNFRILKGTALYTENFTPPTRELEVIPNTVLLACQSTTNAAEEKTGKTITVNGNAVANELTPGLLTNVVKSGGSSAITGSVEFDGTGDYLQTTSSDYALGTSDFTVEYWVNYSSKPSQVTPVTLDDESTIYAPLIGYPSGTPGNAVLYMSSSGSSWDIASGTVFGPITGNSWVHLALTRKGSTFYLFYNGVLANTISSSASVYQSANTITAGYAQANTYFQGFISNLRIIKGTALYTSNFIPPTRKLTKLPGTVLLCCQDSNDPTTEATGKTITGYGSLDRQDIGVELVTNGTFDTDTTGWTISDAGEGSMTVTSGQLVLSNNDTNDPPVYAYQGIATKIGSTYRVSADIVGGTSVSHAVYVHNSSSFGGIYGQFTESSVNKFLTFTAATTTTYILLRVNANQVATSIFDNVSVTKLDPGPKPPFVPQIGSDGSVVFDGTTKINTPNYFYLPTGPTEQREPINNNYGARGILGGGYNGSVWINSLQYVTIATTGNALDFGDLSSGRPYVDAVSSSTRGVFGGGEGNNTMDYITISSTGNAADFGDSTSARRDYAGCSNSTRGLFGGGQGTNIIDYITIASIGNAVDFGDLSSVRYFLGACASPVRGLFAGGDSGAPFALRGIDYVTIASAGNSQTFGGLTNSRSTIRGCSNSIRGVFSGGYTLPGSSNTIDYVNISSTGTATDFGDMTTARGITSAFSSSLRGLFTNWTPSTGVSAIDYINITSTSNALDFGDTITQAQGGCSNGHGGLG